MTKKEELITKLIREGAIDFSEALILIENRPDVMVNIKDINLPQPVLNCSQL